MILVTVIISQSYFKTQNPIVKKHSFGGLKKPTEIFKEKLTNMEPNYDTVEYFPEILISIAKDSVLRNSTPNKPWFDKNVQKLLDYEEQL